MGSNQEEQRSGVTRHADPAGVNAADNVDAAGSTTTDAPADLEAASDTTRSTTNPLSMHETALPHEGLRSTNCDADHDEIIRPTDSERNPVSGAVAILRERSRTTPPPPRRTTFEVLEIDDTYEYEDDDDDLHLTEYELEQQHQMEEEERKLLSTELSSGADDGDKAAGDSASLSDGQAAPPSIPARCLHLCVMVVLKDERSTKPLRVGNFSIFAPSCWYKTGWGTLGPHWFGPLIVAAMTACSGWFFFHEARQDVGIGSATACAVFTVATLYHLANVSLRDPGVVNTRRYQAHLAALAVTPTNDSSGDEIDSREMSSSDASSSEVASSARIATTASLRRRRRDRWCDYCQSTQPADGAHCLDCGVCVAGYDHHCVWMGTCIGKGNMKQFVRFNLCWLAFLLYAILWVSILGPTIFGGH